MDTYEPFAFSDAVFIVRVRRGTGGRSHSAPVSITLEDVATGNRYAFDHERDLVQFLSRFVERLESVA